MLVIKEMINKSNLEGYKLKTIISKIKEEVVLFKRVTFFHIKRDLNEEVDHWAKFTSELSLELRLKLGFLTICQSLKSLVKWDLMNIIYNMNHSLLAS